jgi:hypothetical protein
MSSSANNHQQGEHMFSRSDFKATADRTLVEKIVAFTTSLSWEERDLLLSLVMGRDDLLKDDDIEPITDDEIDSLLRG